MRKLIFLVAVLGLVTSCSSTKKTSSNKAGQEEISFLLSNEENFRLKKMLIKKLTDQEEVSLHLSNEEDFRLKKLLIKRLTDPEEISLHLSNEESFRLKKMLIKRLGTAAGK